MASLGRRAFVGGVVGLGASVLTGGCTDGAVAPPPSRRPWRIGGLFAGEPTKFDVLINLIAAQKLGMTITPSVMAHATEVIR